MVFPGAAFAHESGIHLHTDAPSTNIAFAETLMDKDVFAPGAQFDAKPLDEAQQEEAQQEEAQQEEKQEEPEQKDAEEKAPSEGDQAKGEAAPEAEAEPEKQAE